MEDDMPARTAKRTARKPAAGRKRSPLAKSEKSSKSGSTRRAKSSGAKSATATATASGKGRRAAGGRGLSRPVQPDYKLAVVVGSRPLPRTQVVKKLWDYVKAEGLQDRKNRRMINADDKLKPIFGGKKQVSMFEVAKLISAHVS
jgi:chromatin remodeling complex protein RSC6